MKNNTLFLLTLLLFLLIISCEGVTTDWDSNRESIKFTAIIESANYRASSISWHEGDAIGVFMINKGTTNNISSDQYNAKYINKYGSSEFIAYDESEALYYLNEDSKADFICYYPFLESIDELNYPIDLTVQSNLTKLDLMYSNNAKDLDHTTTNVPVNFSHQLSKLVLNIEQLRSVGLNDITLIISNTGIKASFDLMTGKLSPATEYGNIQLTGNKEKDIVEVILLPEMDITDQELWIISGENEKVYKYALGSNLHDKQYKRSTIYRFNIQSTADDYQVKPVGNITDWISGPVIDVVLEQTDESPPQIKGSKESPFSVSEASANQGIKGAWLEGYIVGGFTGSKVGSFTRDPEKARQSSLAIADQQNETNVNAIFPVELPAGKVRAALNILDNPSNIGKKIIIRGNLERYYSAPGLKNPKEFTFAE